ncbi:MAG TPA: hypothetical protein ENI10_10945 [Halomonas sp.]|nr:hypothetical protein [Halomonas sp.]HEB05096.1 hypothetical protein [Halomonas sp.]
MHGSDLGFVARRKRQRTRGSSAQRCRGLAEVPLGVVPPPSAGASVCSFLSHIRYHALRFVHGSDLGFVARGKRSAPAEAARSGAGVWCGATGRRSAAIRGCLKRSLNSRSSLPRATVCAPSDLGFVARRKRQRTRGSIAQRCRGWWCHKKIRIDF